MIIISASKLWTTTAKCSYSTLSLDGLAPLGSRTYADTVLPMFASRKCTERAPEYLRLMMTGTRQNPSASLAFSDEREINSLYCFIYVPKHSVFFYVRENNQPLEIGDWWPCHIPNYFVHA